MSEIIVTGRKTQIKKRRQVEMGIITFQLPHSLNRRTVMQPGKNEIYAFKIRFYTSQR